MRSLPKVKERIQAVKDFRLSSKAKEIQKFAETPTLFAQQTQPVGNPFVIVPIVSSSRRRYIPMGYVDGNTIVNNRVFIIPNADLYMYSKQAGVATTPALSAQICDGESTLADAIMDRISYDSYKIDIESVDPSKDLSMREVYGLNPAMVK